MDQPNKKKERSLENLSIGRLVLCVLPTLKLVLKEGSISKGLAEEP